MFVLNMLLVLMFNNCISQTINSVDDIKNLLSSFKSISSWNDAEFHVPNVPGQSFESTLEISIHNDWKNRIGIPRAKFQTGGLRTLPHYIDSGATSTILVGNLFGNGSTDGTTKGIISFDVEGVHLARLTIGINLTSVHPFVYIGYLLNLESDFDFILLKEVGKNSWTDFQVGNDLYISIYHGTSHYSRTEIYLFQKDPQLYNNPDIVEEGIYFLTLPLNNARGYAYFGGPVHKLSETITNITSNEHAWKISVIDVTNKIYKLELLNTKLFLGYYEFPTVGIPRDEAFWLTIEGTATQLPDHHFHWKIEKNVQKGFRITIANVPGLGLAGSSCFDRFKMESVLQECQPGLVPKINKLESLAEKGPDYWSFSSVMLEDFVFENVKELDADL
jgi:hypothetical protein